MSKNTKYKLFRLVRLYTVYEEILENSLKLELCIKMCIKYKYAKRPYNIYIQNLSKIPYLIQ